MLPRLPDPNLFMLCRQVNPDAFRAMPPGFSVRLCRREELPLWKRMPYDNAAVAAQYAGFMDDFFNLVYAPKGDLFFQTCLFAVDSDDVPVGTAFLWPAYDAVTTMAWFKVKKGWEGRGIGRALLTVLMARLAPSDYPVLLHTQPSSDRAIKLYTDFGFGLITNARVGRRANHLEACLPLLKAAMPPEAYAKLQFTRAPQALLHLLKKQTLDAF